MKILKVSPDFEKQRKELENILINFDSIGEVFGNQNRNTIRIVGFNDLTLNIKSFRPPKAFNSFVYRYIRKSKAERSFMYANILASKNIGTPKPIAYFENKSITGLKESYYISEHINADLTYRELVEEPNFENHETILREFVHFTHSLHENNILFNDHSPGNTLIKKNKNTYDFYLVDLNRMSFKTLNFSERIKNFSRLTPKEEMVGIMSDEYSKITGDTYQKVFGLMWTLTSKFQEKYYKKQKIKKTLKSLFK